MLRNTFLHVRGVGERTEKKFWKAGVCDWGVFCRNPLRVPVARRVLQALLDELELSEKALETRNADYFCRRLPSRHAWRLYGEFLDDCAFLDVETDPRALTVVGLSFRGRMRFFMRGVNLDEFPGALEGVRVLVTYNGKCFDLPVLRREFGLALKGAHIDLRYVFAALGVRGGLKGVERAMGLRRPPGVEGLDGWDAVRLWHERRRDSWEKLLLYNAFDVLQLEPLLRRACNEWARRLGMPAERFVIEDPREAEEPAREAASRFIARV